MKILILIVAITCFFGCTQQPVEADPTPIKTRPAPSHKPKRMVCSQKIAVVAVIDTGLMVDFLPKNANLCKFGHKDFSGKNKFQNTQYTVDPIPYDSHGHGTNIAGVIQKYAQNSNYCMVILKYYDPTIEKQDALEATIRAIKYATAIGAKYINYSGGGESTSTEEKRAVKAFLDQGGKFIAAAGNERKNIDKYPYYPAMDDPRVVSVGSMEENGTKAYYSNWGSKVTKWEYGTNQVGFGITMSGTSQATAVVTGKFINENECGK